MFKKELPIIFIGLSVVIAVLVLGWTVFVKTEVVAPVWVPVVDNRLKDKTADWLTYENEKYGYNVKYPKDWNFEKLNKDKKVRIEKVLPEINSMGGHDFGSISIEVLNNININSLEQWIEQNYLVAVSQELKFKKEITIDNQKGIYREIANSVSGGYQNDAFIVVGNKMYKMNIDIFIADPEIQNEYQTIIESVINSFKFINPYDIVSDGVDDNDISEIDTSNWKTYRNEEYGFEMKYPKFYLVEDKTKIFTGNDPSMFPWYLRTNFLLNFTEFKDPNLKSEIAFTLEILNTTNKNKIKSSGGWEFIEESETKKIGDLDIHLYSIDSGNNNMQVIFHNDKAYRFFHYLSEEDFDQIISTFKFIE